MTTIGRHVAEYLSSRGLHYSVALCACPAHGALPGEGCEGVPYGACPARRREGRSRMDAHQDPTTQGEKA